MKILQLAVLVLILCSCKNDKLSPDLTFNIVESKELKFDYSHAFIGLDLPTYVLSLKTKALNLNQQDYHAYFNNESSPTPNFTFGISENYLVSNFLPIRYEDGNYYEYKGLNSFYGVASSEETIILKDNIQKGDQWTSEVSTDDGDTIVYNFEVVDKHDVYNEFGIEYRDVYQIKEWFVQRQPSSGHDIITMHYFNRENGIVRREVPTYVSGTYGPIVFNRIE